MDLISRNQEILFKQKLIHVKKKQKNKKKS